MDSEGSPVGIHPKGYTVYLITLTMVMMACFVSCRIWGQNEIKYTVGE